MATSENVRTISVTLAGTVGKGGGVKLSSGTGVPTAAEGDDIIGIAMQDGVSGDVIDVATDGIVPVLCNGTCTAGSRVVVGTTGAIDTNANGRDIGHCLETGATGELRRVLLTLNGNVAA